MDGYRHPNDMAPIRNGAGQPQRRSQGQELPIPTVNEALPYTPFSSIVPFNPRRSTSLHSAS